MAIGNSRLLRQQPFPGFLRIVEHERDKLHQRLFRFVAGGIRPVDSCGDRRSRAASQQGEKVLLEEEAQDEKDHYAAEADVHSAKAESSPASAPVVFVSAILNVTACPARCPAHRRSPVRMSPGWRSSFDRFKILPFRSIKARTTKTDPRILPTSRQGLQYPPFRSSILSNLGPFFQLLCPRQNCIHLVNSLAV